jgi:hypothetical protein
MGDADIRQHDVVKEYRRCGKAASIYTCESVILNLSR